MFFTQEDFRKIEEYLRLNSKKDTDFPYINGEVLSTEDKVAIIHNGLNKTTTIEDIFSKYNVEDISAERVVDANYNKSLNTINQELYEATSNNNIPTKTVITKAIKTDYVPIIRDGLIYLISFENLTISTQHVSDIVDEEINNADYSKYNIINIDRPNTQGGVVSWGDDYIVTGRIGNQFHGEIWLYNNNNGDDTDEYTDKYNEPGNYTWEGESYDINDAIIVNGHLYVKVANEATETQVRWEDKGLYNPNALLNNVIDREVTRLLSGNLNDIAPDVNIEEETQDNTNTTYRLYDTVVLNDKGVAWVNKSLINSTGTSSPKVGDYIDANNAFLIIDSIDTDKYICHKYTT